MRRRLIWHGFLLFLLGTAYTMINKFLRTPQLPVWAEAEWDTAAIYLVMLGLIWDHLHLSARFLAATFWLSVIGSYGSLIGAVVARALFSQKDVLSILALEVPPLITLVAGNILAFVGVSRKAEKP